MTTATCPKCNHARALDDGNPTNRCPACGIVYAKVGTNAGETKKTIPSAWKESDSALAKCEMCNKGISPQASSCPACGHPNQDAPRTAGLIAGTIAIQLGIMSILMPYFATVFIVPAAFSAAAITAILRLRSIALVAALMASFGLYNIYQTSKEIRAAGEHAQEQYRNAQREAERIQKNMERELEKYRGY